MKTQPTPTPISQERTEDGDILLIDARGFRIAQMIRGASVFQDDNAAFIVRAVNAHEELVQMLAHIEAWLRDRYFIKDEAHCLQKAYEVAQAIAKAEDL